MSKQQGLVWQGASMFRPQDPMPQPPAEKVQSLADQLNDLKDIAMKPSHAMRELLVGHPEKIAEPGYDMIGSRDLSVSVPNWAEGAADLATALPVFGTVARGGLELSGGIIRGMKPFFSQLYRTIAERVPERATAEQILNVARKGSKAEELAYSGLENFLKPGQKYMKTDVLKHLEANAPELHERVVGVGTPKYTVINDKGIRKGVFDSPDAAHDYINESGRHDLDVIIEPHNDVMRPKFTSYTLPGGENHRELVVTLPTKGSRAERLSFNHALLEDILNRRLRAINMDELNEAQLEAIRGHDVTERAGVIEQMHRIGVDTSDLSEDILYPSGNGPASNYHVPSGHAYGDPELDVNRLFHIRMNDRDAGKTLFMEELQSDWHQAGRKEGYATGKKAYDVRRIERGDIPWLEENMNIPLDDMEGGWVLVDKDDNRYPLIAEPNLTREQALNNIQRDLAENPDLAEITEINPTLENAVPDAPFKTTWQEFGMKRMLQEAAAGGYDRLAWTTGKQQADRYSLRKYGVEKLTYDNDGHWLNAYDKHGNKMVTHTVKPKNLGQYLPKGIVKELTGDGLKQVTGDALDVGGYGMEEFYDTMLPSYMDRYGKKFGARVERHEIDLPSKHVSYVNADDGEPITGMHLSDMIGNERDMMLQNEREDIENMSRDELVERLGLNEEDMRPGGDYGDEGKTDLIGRLIRHTREDLDTEQYATMEKRINELYKKHYGNRLISNPNLEGLIYGLRKQDIIDELVGHHGYDAEDFVSGGEYANHTDKRLREAAMKQAEHDQMSDRDIITNLLDAGLIEKAPNEKQSVWSMKITPEMRQAILREGQPLFAAVPAIALANRQKSDDSQSRRIEPMPAHQTTRSRRP